MERDRIARDDERDRRQRAGDEIRDQTLASITQVLAAMAPRPRPEPSAFDDRPPPRPQFGRSPRRSASPLQEAAARSEERRDRNARKDAQRGSDNELL